MRLLELRGQARHSRVRTQVYQPLQSSLLVNHIGTSLVKDLPRVVKRRAQRRLQASRPHGRVAQGRRARRLDRLEALLEARDELVAETGLGLVGASEHFEVDADIGEAFLTIQFPRSALDGLQHDQRRPGDHDEVPVGPDGAVVEVQPQRRARREQQLELLVGRDAVRVQVAPARRVVDGQHDEPVQHVLAEHQGAVLFRHGRRRGRRGGGGRRQVVGPGARSSVAAAEVDEPLV
ncbi:hypothetical protein PG990_004239 [Apiospora arundinis]